MHDAKKKTRVHRRMRRRRGRAACKGKRKRKAKEGNKRFSHKIPVPLSHAYTLIHLHICVRIRARISSACMRLSTPGPGWLARPENESVHRRCQSSIAVGVSVHPCLSRGIHLSVYLSVSLCLFAPCTCAKCLQVGSLSMHGRTCTRSPSVCIQMCTYTVFVCVCMNECQVAGFCFRVTAKKKKKREAREVDLGASSSLFYQQRARSGRGGG